MARGIFKRISDAVLNADQARINEWFINLDKEAECAKKQAQVKIKIFETFNAGVSVGKISEITGIPAQTIYGWLEQDRKAKQKAEASSHA